MCKSKEGMMSDQTSQLTRLSCKHEAGTASDQVS